METAPAFASTDEAMDMARAALGYLAATDATQLSAATQARCLKAFEQADAIGMPARASFLAAFTAGQGYADDAAYSARAWLIHQTHITSGAAVGHTAWAKRTRTHPAGPRRPGRRGDLYVDRAADLPVDRQAPGALARSFR